MKDISFWCVILGIMIIMVFHHILSSGPLIEGQENGPDETGEKEQSEEQSEENSGGERMVEVSFDIKKNTTKGSVVVGNGEKDSVNNLSETGIMDGKTIGESQDDDWQTKKRELEETISDLRKKLENTKQEPPLDTSGGPSVDLTEDPLVEITT